MYELNGGFAACVRGAGRCGQHLPFTCERFIRKLKIRYCSGPLIHPVQSFIVNDPIALLAVHGNIRNAAVKGLQMIQLFLDGIEQIELARRQGFIICGAHSA
ncbi:hypothetical protein D3C81_2063450 [compost metagenome]